MSTANKKFTPTNDDAKLIQLLDYINKRELAWLASSLTFLISLITLICNLTLTSNLTSENVFPYRAREDRVNSLAEFNRMGIGDAGVIEGVVDCPLDSSLGVAAQMLMHFYAVLLADDLWEVKGIITRADLLKLLF